MWSIKYRTLNRSLDYKTSLCRVCRQKTTKIHVTEKKVMSILWLINISLKKEYSEICSECKARVFVTPESIDF